MELVGRWVVVVVVWRGLFFVLFFERIHPSCMYEAFSPLFTVPLVKANTGGVGGRGGRRTLT